VRKRDAHNALAVVQLVVGFGAEAERRVVAVDRLAVGAEPHRIAGTGELRGAVAAQRAHLLRRIVGGLRGLRGLRGP